MATEFDAAINLLIKARQDTDPAFSQLHNNLTKATSGVSALSLATNLLTGVAVGGAIRQLQVFANAAHETEQAELRLANAVDQNGGNWATQRAQIEQNIETNRRFAFSDNQLRDSLSVLTVESGSYVEAVARQKVAMDLARATGMDLYTASRLIGRVTDENIGVLKRWGITVRQGASEEEFLAEVQKRTAGAADRYADSNVAAAERMRNSFEALQASAGEALGPIANLSNVAQGLPTIAGGVASAVGFFSTKVMVAGVETTKFASSLSRIGQIAPTVGKNLGVAALLAGEFFGIIGGAAALGREGVPVLDNLSNKEGTGSLDMLQKIAEKKGWLTTFGLLKDEILGIKQPAETTAQSVDKLRASLGKFPDILDQISGRMSGKGGGGLARAGNLTAGLSKELQDTFGAQADDPAIKYFEDLLNNVVGATPAQRYKELGDQLYKRFHDKVQGELVDPLLAMKAEMDQPGQAGTDAITKYAKESGKTRGQFLKDFSKELADAQTRLAETDSVVKGLIDRGAEKQKQAVEDFHARQKTLLMVEKDSVWEVAGAYDALNAKRAGAGAGTWNPYGTVGVPGVTPTPSPSGAGTYSAYGTMGVPGMGSHQVGTDMTVSGPTWMRVGEQGVRERVLISPEGVGGRGRMGGHSFTIAPVLHYSGSADKAAAARLSADIVDNVTEALRQGFRRIGDRSSPFGA